MIQLHNTIVDDKRIRQEELVVFIECKWLLKKNTVCFAAK